MLYGIDNLFVIGTYRYHSLHTHYSTTLDMYSTNSNLSVLCSYLLMKQLVELTQTGLDTVHLTLYVSYDALQGALTELHMTANLFILSSKSGISCEFVLQGNVIN